MAGNDRKRQKKAERKTARRKEKKKALIRQESGGLPARLTAAAKYPVLHCWMTDSNSEQGMGYVTLSRAMPEGNVAVACFLVDSYCLGVKDLVLEVMHRTSYDERFERKMRRDMPGPDVSPEDACKFVTGAANYARSLGFSPHPDYSKGMLLFADIDPARSTATFEFGKDGKPFYVRGPNETLPRARQIVAMLHNQCGPGGYDYLIPFDDPSRIPDDVEFKPLPDERRDWSE